MERRGAETETTTLPVQAKLTELILCIQRVDFA